MIGGWNLFNFVEGFMNLHLLKLNFEKEISSNSVAWDWGLH
jgi:uncharacterized membrane protein